MLVNQIKNRKVFLLFFLVVVLNYNLLVLEGKLFKKIQKKTESLL